MDKEQIDTIIVVLSIAFLFSLIIFLAGCSKETDRISTPIYVTDTLKLNNTNLTCAKLYINNIREDIPQQSSYWYWYSSVNNNTNVTYIVKRDTRVTVQLRRVC